MKVEVKLLDDRLMSPNYATLGSAGADLRACNVNGRPLLPGETFHLYPHATAQVGTGLAIHLGSVLDEDGYIPMPCSDEDSQIILGGLLIPRSGLGTKHKIRLANTIGLLDADYQGELILTLENRGDDKFVIEPLMRLAQLAVVPVFRPKFDVVDEFSFKTDRGEGGHGSTGLL